MPRAECHEVDGNIKCSTRLYLDKNSSRTVIYSVGSAVSKNRDYAYPNIRSSFESKHRMIPIY